MDIWTEKYRPKHLKDVIGQESIVKRLTAFTLTDSMPHLLFAGPPGTGKTTCALALANDIYKDSVKENFLELNASDERGIDTIRVKVKNFARSKSIGNVNFKIIIAAGKIIKVFIQIYKHFCYTYFIKWSYQRKI